MGQTHMPNDRFNLFHIDNGEMHFDSINASAFLLDEPGADLESSHLLQHGNLHICSRSVIFD